MDVWTCSQLNVQPMKKQKKQTQTPHRLWICSHHVTLGWLLGKQFSQWLFKKNHNLMLHPLNLPQIRAPWLHSVISLPPRPFENIAPIITCLYTERTMHRTRKKPATTLCASNLSLRPPRLLIARTLVSEGCSRSSVKRWDLSCSLQQA